MCLDGLRGVTWAVWAGLHYDKIVDWSWRHDFRGAEHGSCSFSLRERTKEHPRGSALLGISPVPLPEQVGCSGAVEDCPLLVRIGGAWGEAGGWVSRLKKGSLV